MAEHDDDLPIVTRAMIDRLDALFGPPASTFKRKPKTIPHCDCVHALRAAGIYVNPSVGEGHGKGMAPTDQNADGGCVHCGYTVCFLEPRQAEAECAHRAGKSKQQSGKRRGKYTPNNAHRKVPYKAVHVETGEELYFESNNKARDAGFTNVVAAIRKQIAHKGYFWYRAES